MPHHFPLLARGFADLLQPGGQDSQLVAPDLSTHLDATYLLQTHDHPPAYISVKTEGWRVGPREILEKLEDPAVADEVDPKSYSFRLFVHMETGDTRYLHLNTGMWVGTGVRRGTEGKSPLSLIDSGLFLTWELQSSMMHTVSPRWLLFAKGGFGRTRALGFRKRACDTNEGSSPGVEAEYNSPYSGLASWSDLLYSRLVWRLWARYHDTILLDPLVVDTSISLHQIVTVPLIELKGSTHTSHSIFPTAPSALR